MFLFICMTNLHLLIARSIIEKEQLKSVDVLFIGDVDNVKNQYYLKKSNRYVGTQAWSLRFQSFRHLKRFIEHGMLKKSWNLMPENIIPFSLRIFMFRLYTIFYRASLFLK